MPVVRPSLHSEQPTALRPPAERYWPRGAWRLGLGVALLGVALLSQAKLRASPELQRRQHRPDTLQRRLETALQLQLNQVDRQLHSTAALLDRQGIPSSPESLQTLLQLPQREVLTWGMVSRSSTTAPWRVSALASMQGQRLPSPSSTAQAETLQTALLRTLNQPTTEHQAMVLMPEERQHNLWLLLTPPQPLSQPLAQSPQDKTQQLRLFALLQPGATVTQSLEHPLLGLNDPVDLRLRSDADGQPGAVIYDSRGLMDGPGPRGAAPSAITLQGRRMWLEASRSWAVSDLAGRLPLLSVGLWAGAGLCLGQELLGELRRRRRHQQQLMRCEQQLQGERRRVELGAAVLAAVNDLDEGILVTDGEGTIHFANTAFQRISGHPAGELIGRNPRLLKSGYQQEDFYRQLWQQLRTRGTWHGEIWNRRGDGTPYPQWMQIRSVTGRLSGPLQYVATVRDLTSQHQLEQQLEHYAFHNLITGLPNPELARLRLLRLLQQGVSVAVLWIGFPSLERVREAFGQGQANQVLQAVAERLQRCLASTDLLACDGNARLIVLHDLGASHHGASDPPDDDATRRARLFSNRLLRELQQPVQLTTGLELEVIGRSGLCVAPQQTDRAEQALQFALVALDEARDAPPLSCTTFTTAMAAQHQRQLGLEAELQQAIERGGLRLVYQPQVDGSGRLQGAEALLRWSSQLFGDVPPPEFIDIAETTGAIQMLGNWALEQGCWQWQHWLDQGLEPGRLAVNVSNHQFCNPRQALPDKVRDVLRQTGLAEERLELEITESALAPNLHAGAQLQELAAIGIELAVDDFGTGFSSLQSLHRQPVNKLKIDRCFVQQIHHDQGARAIVQATIALAENLGLQILAEGVETAEELQTLISLGCNRFQGFLFHRPLSVEAFTELLKREQALEAATQRQP